MRLARCFYVYVKASWRYLARFYAVCLAFLALAFAAFRLEVYAATLGDIAIAHNGGWSMGDYLLYALCGCVGLGDGGREGFSFPIAWFAVFALLGYGCLRAPFGEENSFGNQLLLATGSRCIWWVTRCLWVGASLFAFWALLLLVAALFAWQEGGVVSFGVSSELFYLIEFPWQEIKGPPYTMAPTFLAAVAVSFAVAMAQTVISLAAAPIVGFGASLAFWALGAIGPAGFPFASGVMAARNASFVLNGTQSGATVAWALVAGVAFFALGAVIFARKSLMGRG